MCSDTQGNNGSSHLVYTDSPTTGQDYPAFGVTWPVCKLPSFTPSNDYTYDLQIFQDSDTIWKFGLRVRDPNNNYANVISPMVVDPNSATFTNAWWFPIDWLTPDGPHAPANEGGGYITFGVARYDPNNGQTYSTAPSMAATRVAVFR
jgi:hypothetical protein